MEQLRNSLYFYVSLRSLCVLCCVIILFAIAMSDNWTSRIPAVIGLTFTLVSLLFISCSMATLFAWDLDSMSLPRRSVFVWVFLLCSLIAAVMYLVAPSVCDKFNQYGCFVTQQSTGFKIAAAFSIINVVFGIFDVALNFVFYFRDRNDGTVHAVADRPVPTISVIDITQDEPYEVERKGQSTYV